MGKEHHHRIKRNSKIVRGKKLGIKVAVKE